MNLKLPVSKLTLVLVLVLAGVFNSFAQFDADSMVINVAEDNYAGELDPAANYNGVTDMGVALDDGNSRETYLTFNISELHGLGKVGTASLNFVAAVKSDGEWIPLDDFFINVYAVTGTWSEGTLNWINKPSCGEEILAQGNIHIEAGRYYLYGTQEDNTSFGKYIQKALDEGLQTVSFVVKAANNTPGSRIWISDKGWEPAKLSVVFEELIIEKYVDKINVSGAGNASSITTDNGTLQMNAEVLPADADVKDVVWSVTNETGKASISKTGVLTAISNGTVTVKADATDGSYTQGTLDITISGQFIAENDIWNNLNLIRNWNTTTDLAGWGGYQDMSVPGSVVPLLDEGVVVMKVGIAEAASWKYQFTQNQLQAEPNIPYVVKFKAWASGNAPATVDFEDTEANGFNRYGLSTDASAVNGRSEWHFNLTAEPQWFTYHVTFDQIIESTDQKLQFLLAQSNETIYLDSVLLVKAADLELMTGSKTMENSITRVYPNPVGNSGTLVVDLSAIHSKVAVYNATGQKLMEKKADGYRVNFNVSGLPKGLYFIRTEDGSSQKFIR